MFNQANEPAAAEGGRPKPQDLKDHLLIVRVIEHSPDNPMGITRTSKNAETGQEIKTPADCIIADVVDLDADDQPVYYDYVFLQARLIAHFKTNVGNTLVGIIGQHPDQGERKGAYYFTDRFGFRRDAATAEAWGNNHPEFFTTQAPGNTARVSNAPTQNGGGSSDGFADSVHNQHEPSGSESTLDRMRNARNNDAEAPF